MVSLENRATELRSLIQSIIKQLRRVDELTVAAPEFEVNVQELKVIENLGDCGAMKMGQLAEDLRLALSSVTSIVDHMENKKIIRRVRSEEDRRVVWVELTDSGKAVYDYCLGEKFRFIKGILQTLTEDEQEIFLVLFRKIARRAGEGVGSVLHISEPGPNADRNHLDP